MSRQYPVYMARAAVALRATVRAGMYGRMRPRPLVVCMSRPGRYSGRLHRMCTRGCAGGRRKLDCQEQGSRSHEEGMVVQQVTQHRLSLSD